MTALLTLSVPPGCALDALEPEADEIVGSPLEPVSVPPVAGVTGSDVVGVVSVPVSVVAAVTVSVADAACDPPAPVQDTE